MTRSVPLSRFTLRVGGGSAFFVRPLCVFLYEIGEFGLWLRCLCSDSTLFLPFHGLSYGTLFCYIRCRHISRSIQTSSQRAAGLRRFIIFAQLQELLDAGIFLLRLFWSLAV